MSHPVHSLTPVCRGCFSIGLPALPRGFLEDLFGVLRLPAPLSAGVACPRDASLLTVLIIAPLLMLVKNFF